MRKIINGKVYDTETATEVAYWESGNKTSAAWYDETLYRKRNGEFFIFGQGYAASPYSQQRTDGSYGPGSRIRPVSWDDAKLWAQDKLSDDDFDDLFGKIEEDTSKVVTTISLSASTLQTAKRNAARLGTSLSGYIEHLVLHGITQTSKVTKRGNEAISIDTYEHYTPEEKDAILARAERFDCEVSEEDGKLNIISGFKDFPASN